MSINKIKCWIFGHWVLELFIGLATAKCGRCGRTFKVHYDGLYGETVFDFEVDASALNANPGTPEHVAQIVAHELRNKGIPSEQEYKDGKPVHDLVVKVIK